MFSNMIFSTTKTQNSFVGQDENESVQLYVLRGTHFSGKSCFENLEVSKFEKFEKKMQIMIFLSDFG